MRAGLCAGQRGVRGVEEGGFGGIADEELLGFLRIWRQVLG